ncbi:hypothetical protein ABIE27_001984 [Paenibacillus sp. 4624]|uniref:hypothetical protein n=1 Tax=Paenibacillus TaxID=44249 RepID=UPI00280ABA3A|nr:hypothetical protein [Paenibacillus polysaccharolyticus]
MKTIAKLPQERKLWILRKYVYGGLPPTDPRILAMTPEQIDLEFEHMEIDRKAKEGKSEEYDDPEFDDWLNETEEEDGKLSYDYSATRKSPIEDDDWEDA